MGYGELGRRAINIIFRELGSNGNYFRGVLEQARYKIQDTRNLSYRRFP